jgi:hypothetical protein
MDVVRDRLRRRLERPADAVLDLLRRVRLREALPEEVLEEAAVVAQPVVVVVLRPALVGLERLVERMDGALGKRRCERDRRPDEGGAGHALRVLRGEQHPPERGARHPDDDGALRLRGVEHGERVERELADRVRLGARGPVGAPVSAPVERDHAAVPRQVRNLQLPVARVDDRPGRQEQDGRLPRPVDLVEDPHAVALDVPLRIGVAGARLLVEVRSQLDSHWSIQSRSSL